MIHQNEKVRQIKGRNGLQEIGNLTKEKGKKIFRMIMRRQGERAMKPDWSRLEASRRVGSRK